MIKQIAVFKNEADGIESHVSEIDKGYSVVLKDTDADEFIGMAVIYPFHLPNAKDRAIVKAKEIVKIY